MNPASNIRRGGVDPRAGEADTSKTPSTDMQAEDAGTAESGKEEGSASDSGTQATSAMKQTSKTPTERGSVG